MSLTPDSRESVKCDHIPELEEVASLIGLRLSGTEEKPASYRPQAAKTDKAKRALDKIVKRAVGPLWITNIAEFGEEVSYSPPTKAIGAWDLIDELVAHNTNTSLAKWAVFLSIESGELLAVVETRRRVTPTQNTRTLFFSDGRPPGKVVRSGPPLPPKVDVLRRLLDWSPSQKKSKGRRGRPYGSQTSSEEKNGNSLAVCSSLGG